MAETTPEPKPEEKKPTPTQRTPRTKKPTVDDSQGLKDTQEIAQMGEENNGSSLDLQGMAYLNSQVDVSETIDITKHLANPSKNMMDARDAVMKKKDSRGDKK